MHLSSANSEETALSFPRFPRLDGWRGLSILLVLIGHVCHKQKLVMLSELGVIFFFVLSGFLITGLLCAEELREGAISIKSFFRRRILRIMPAYYVFLTIIGLLCLLKLVTDVTPQTFIYCMFYLRDFLGPGWTLAHTWSLSLEEQFYLVWPFFLWLTPPPRRVPILIVVCLAVASWRSVASVIGLWLPATLCRPDFQCDAILLGCLIGLLWSYRRQQLLSIKMPLWIVLIFAITTFSWTVFAANLVVYRPIHQTGVCWMSALLLAQVIAHSTGKLPKLLANPILCWFGKVSYSIYLWQQLFIITKEPSWGLVRTFPFDVCLAIIAGTASYYLLEQPVQRWGRKKWRV